MSLIPSGITPTHDIGLYTSAQVAVTCAALYDHVLSLGREVELIWMKPISLITVLYVAERYLGDVVLIAGLCLCFSTSKSEEEYVNVFKTMTSDLDNILSWLGLRAWGALAYSWATQATMQLRIYAMYRRSRRMLILLLTSFLCEIFAIAFIIWRTIGPRSPLKALTPVVASGQHFCAFSGVNGSFVYIFIPFLCFEFFLFVLAGRMFIENMKSSWKARDDSVLGVNSFMKIMARDSLWYFFVNLVTCGVVMGLWQSITELYANICVPFVMLLEVLVGTRLILNFRERYARPDDLVLSARSRCSSLCFRGEDMHRDSAYISIRCDVETIVITDIGT